MTDPVDVQAERLRELAEALEQSNAHGPWHWQHSYPQRVSNAAAILIAECFEDPDQPSRIAEFIAECDPQTVLALLDLLAGQAEQIEAWEKQFPHCDAAGARYAYDHAVKCAEAAVRQRDNLRDAANAASIGLECAIKVHSAVVMDTPEDERIKAGAVAAMQLALDKAREALRAAAVGEGGGDEPMCMCGHLSGDHYPSDDGCFECSCLGFVAAKGEDARRHEHQADVCRRSSGAVA